MEGVQRPALAPPNKTQNVRLEKEEGELIIPPAYAPTLNLAKQNSPRLSASVEQ
jgi:hypothetical protein